MPTSIPRIAYFGQTATVSLKTKGGNYTLPVSTANIEVTRPIEAVTAFGKFNSLNTAQTNLTTCKSTLKCYMGRGTNVQGINASILSDLIEETQKGQITVTVTPAGFSMVGILTSVGMDISLGGFGMIDLGFAGVGNPTINAATDATTVQGETFAIEPVTTMSVSIPNVAATSLKFSYDLPTDVLGALGENPNASQDQMVSRIATKAPYKSTLTVEGYGVDITQSLVDANVRSAVTIGDIAVQLKNGKVSARSFNNAAGQVSATFSYTVEDVGALFTAASVMNSYTQNFDQSNLPSYGSDLLT